MEKQEAPDVAAAGDRYSGPYGFDLPPSPSSSASAEPDPIALLQGLLSELIAKIKSDEASSSTIACIRLTIPIKILDSAHTFKRKDSRTKASPPTLPTFEELRKLTKKDGTEKTSESNFTFYYELLDEIEDLFKTYLTEGMDANVLSIINDFPTRKPGGLYESLKFILLGFYFRFIQNEMEIAEANFSQATRSGFIDAIYYYVRIMLSNIKDVKKRDSHSVRVALYYCRKLSEVYEHLGATLLFNELTRRNWRDSLELPAAIQYSSRDEYFAVFFTSATGHIVGTMKGLLKPTKFMKNSMKVPEPLMPIARVTTEALTDKIPLSYMILAEIWMHCYKSESAVDQTPQHFCGVRACRQLRSAAWLAHKEGDQSTAHWALAEMRNIMNLAHDSSVVSEVNYVNARGEAKSRKRNYQSKLPYDPLELPWYIYYYYTTILVIDPNYRPVNKQQQRLSYITLEQLVDNAVKLNPAVWRLGFLMDCQRYPEEIYESVENPGHKDAPSIAVHAQRAFRKLNIYPDLCDQIDTKVIRRSRDLSLVEDLRSRQRTSQNLDQCIRFTMEILDTVGE